MDTNWWPIALLGFLVIHFPVYYQLYVDHWARDLRGGVASALLAPVFYRLYPSSEGTQFEPIDISLFATLTNDTRHPVQIEGYSVSAFVRGEWKILGKLRVPVADPLGVAAIWRNQALMRLDLSENGFDYLVQQTVLAPGETIRGWIFFRSGLTESQMSEIKKYKIAVLTTTQRRYTIISPAPGTTTQSPESAIVSNFKLLPIEPLPESMQYLIRR